MVTDEQRRQMTNDKIERYYQIGMDAATKATTDEERRRGIDIFCTGLDIAVKATANAIEEIKKTNLHS